MNATLTAPQLKQGLNLRGVGIALAIAALVVQANYVCEVNLRDLFTGYPHILDIIYRGMPPDGATLKNAGWGALVTFDVAVLGTIGSVIFSLPLALLAANNTRPSHFAYLASRGIIGLTRTIPDVVWALIFVTAVGLGPFAAMLGLAVHSVGVLARLYAEAIEDVAMGPVHALTVMGANRLQVATQAVIPSVLPTMIGLTLYRLDTNVRSSLVLGFVGGGGLGLQIEAALNLFQYRQLTMLLIVMGALIIGVEAASVYLRKRIH
ncbi:MAG: phosphonate ABC transporter, permease protein PhnE [Candidatus Eremiobacteraeota bacterium]|nr:phosphonate ABC transporter, permease protein PhnE [Candidatus Eremiobacteraeota bacterium]